MTQAAYNGALDIPKDTWTLISEVNCSFVVERGTVEILATQSAAPDADASGVTYSTGEGVPVTTDLLALYPGAGTANGIYATSRGRSARLFVSRAAVA